MIQVLIPTRRRASLLRVALQSVRAQTAVERIGSVIVSENGGDRESERVCREFSDLPITYMFQEPELDNLAHFGLLATVELQPFTAFLCDDDWWTPGHLEVALRELEARPDCQAYYSTYLQIVGGSPPSLHRGAWRIWAAGGEDFRPQVLRLSFVQSLVANLPNFTFHYSSLVARTSAFKAAIELMVEQKNFFDNDRVVSLLLADPGGLICSTIPTVMIRCHPEQEARSPVHAIKGVGSIMADTTRWIQRRWPEQCQEAAASFNATVDRISADQWREISKDVYEPLLSTVIDEIGFRLWRPPVPSIEKYKRLMPAGMRGVLRRCRRSLPFRKG